MFYPSLKEVQKLARSGDFKTAPISMDLLSDLKTPIEVLRILKNVSSHCYMLESVLDNEKWGRYTFLGYDPKMEITCLDGEMKIGDKTLRTSQPEKYIRQVLKDYKSASIPGLPSFTGGLVGYFSYDYLKYGQSDLRLDALDREGFMDLDLMLFDKVIAFDNFKQKIILIVNIFLNDYESEYERAKKDLLKMADLICKGQAKVEKAGRLKSKIIPLFNRDRYIGMVRQALDHIKRGDISQIVLSNRFEAKYEGSLLNCYRILRSINPSPYMFYFYSPDMEVAGASPETLVRLEAGVLHTFPLAGTRPRGQTEEEDKRLEAELLADPKELAEHDMLVDLSQYDLEKICTSGSVVVEKYHSIERYSHVMHIGSTVRGDLAEGRDALDAIGAILPAGTLSGMPKLKSCQLINDIENNKRGIYGGAIGYLDFTGNMDTCIAIRIAYKKNNKVFVRSGAGIVAGSLPEREHEECLNKARALIKALELADQLG
ncbi:MAG: anthranilate synthase component I family protein [Bacillota bacterium]|jgi:anthranilate synthase component 1|nr:anthranilate synthase component I family protein [Bacillota bacterium]